MASQNVCYYNKFGHCKFSDRCRSLHISELCENPSCEISSCKLRHPRICKYFRDYDRCKFSDYCSYKHVKNSSCNHINNKELLKKIDNLLQIIEKKDEIFNIFAAKIKALEEKINGVIENEDQHDDTGNEMNNTFCNPFSAFPCDYCDFNAKSSAGLQLHVKAKHKENIEPSNQLSLPLIPQMAV